MLTAFANGTLFGQRWGTGAPRVLALHGWRGDSSQMKPSCGSFDTIALDLPGFGASVAPGEVWGAVDYAKALESSLYEFDEPCVIVGYSFGGRVAVNLATLYPDKVKALVLTGVPLLRRQSNKKSALSFRAMKWAASKNLISQERMEQIRRQHGSADYRAASGLMRDVFVKVVNETYEDQLRSLRSPVHMVWGSADTEAPVWIVKEAESLLAARAASTTIIDGADHWFPIKEPQPLTNVVAEALT